MIQDKSFRFYWHSSWRMLWRDWRGGELNILAVGLIIAITSITAVGFFTDRIERGLTLQSAELMAADLVITSSSSEVLQYEKQARAQGFDVAITQQFRSIVSTENNIQLVEVKAVSAAYPLRGSLRVSTDAFGVDEATDDIPAAGDVWVEAGLLQKLALSVGDDITLGQKSFTIRKVLRYEPDRAGDMFSVAPRVLMSYSDVAATGLNNTGSLVSYRVLIAGLQKRIKSYKRLLENTLKPGEKLMTPQEGRPELNSALLKAQQFLGLAALISVLIAGVAVATVAYRFTHRHLDTSAMLRCLGASQREIISLFFMEMLWLALIASSIGCLLGLLMQFIITELLDQLVIAQLPLPSFKTVILGYVTGIVMLIGFAMPPLLALKRVPPLRVLRKDTPVSTIGGGLVYAGIVSCMSLLLYWQIGDIRLLTIVITGLIILLTVLALAAYLLIMGLNRYRDRVGVEWRFGLANISRRPMSSVIQVVTFGLGIMVMLLLFAVRSDLLDNWQGSLPVDAPNHFVINIQDDQVDGVRDYFSQMGVVNTRLYPMVRARLTEVNDKTVSSLDYTSDRAKRLVTREFNLSWAATMQSDNTLAAGVWWDDADAGQPWISMESNLAKTLGLSLNDVLSFNINGRLIDFRITNLRNVNWDSFNVNFFTVVPPGVLDGQIANWITSVHLDLQQRSHLDGLVKNYPNITLIDIDTIMKRVRDIMDRISLALEFIFTFTLMAGLAVLYAAIQANQDERRYENAILRTLGAKRKTLLLGLAAEFATIGALSGLLAGLAATLFAWALAKWVFDFQYQFDAAVVLYGAVSGIIIVVGAGLLGTRQVLSHPPIETLRESVY